MRDTHEIEAAISELEQRYVDANPDSLARFQRAQASMPGGNTRTALHFDPFPLYVDSSEGSKVTDVDGHTYIDALSEFSAGLYGHKHPAIDAATRCALDTGASNGAPGTGEIDLAEVICSRFPGIEQVRFCNSGTEANLYALQLARHVTGRSKLMAFHGAYHGGVFVFSDVDNAMNAPFDWIFGTYNAVQDTVDLIRAHSHDLAAVIVEPMMSNAGSLPADPEFLQALRDVCDETGTLLIYDEVVTSRIGKGGLQEFYGVLPDLTTLGKYIGAGFSFGAFGGRADILDHMNPLREGALPHAGTFNNNMFSMLAGYVGLTEIFTPERAVKLTEDGDVLRDRLNAVVRDWNVAAQFTGKGSIMNLHFTAGKIRGSQDLKDVPRLPYKLFQLDMILSGVYLARRGQINMSLAITPSDTDHIVGAVKSFFQRHASLI